MATCDIPSNISGQLFFDSMINGRRWMWIKPARHVLLLCKLIRQERHRTWRAKMEQILIEQLS